MIEEPKEKFIRGSYQISLEIAGRRINIGGYIKDGQSKEELIAEMTEMQEVIDHQVVRADLKSMEGKLKGALAGLENMTDEYEKLIAKKKEGKKLHAQDEAKVRNFDPTTDQLKANILYFRQVIAENRKTLGMPPEGAALQ